ncbi:MAG: class I SAM-dependent methyltransferase [Bacteroidales bacterium]|nr:class I SAM-dependent methyltransferase [Bacteroidales bacterium]
MSNKIMSETFNEVSRKYDQQRRLFIPCYEDYYGASVSFLSFIRPNVNNILDLGAGTGLLTEYLFDKYPNAFFTLIDIAEQMLEVAKQKFLYKANFKFLVGDYTENLPGESYELISSALSIHHLSEEKKFKLYKNSFETLIDGGVLLNLDQFNSSSKEMNEYFTKYWYSFIDKSGISEQEKEVWLKRRELDKENSINETKNMLYNVGFKIVECIYSYQKFGVIIAIK